MPVFVFKDDRLRIEALKGEEDQGHPEDESPDRAFEDLHGMLFQVFRLHVNSSSIFACSCQNTLSNMKAMRTRLTKRASVMSGRWGRSLSNSFLTKPVREEGTLACIVPGPA